MLFLARTGCQWRYLDLISSRCCSAGWRLENPDQERDSDQQRDSTDRRPERRVVERAARRRLPRDQSEPETAERRQLARNSGQTARPPSERNDQQRDGDRREEHHGRRENSRDPQRGSQEP